MYYIYKSYITYIYIYTPYISFTSIRLYIYISLDMHVYLDHVDKNIATIGPRPAAWAPASPWPPDGALASLVSGIRWINGSLGPTFRMKMDEGWFTFSKNEHFWDFMKDTDLFFPGSSGNWRSVFSVKRWCVARLWCQVGCHDLSHDLWSCRAVDWKLSLLFPLHGCFMPQQSLHGSSAMRMTVCGYGSH